MIFKDDIQALRGAYRNYEALLNKGYNHIEKCMSSPTGQKIGETVAISVLAPIAAVVVSTVTPVLIARESIKQVRNVWRDKQLNLF